MISFLKTVVGLVLFFVAAAIALTILRNASRQPSTIISDSECNPPCWSGIQPGETDASQVYGILGRLNGVSKDSVMPEYDKDDNLIRIWWYFEHPVEDGTGSVNIENDLVTAINILTVNSLKLADLFGRLGEPEAYWAEIGRGENREYLDVTLLYPTKGCAAEVVIDIEDGAKQVEIRDGTSVFRVTYFAPETYQDLLKTRTLIDKAAIARSGYFAPWSGFGTIPLEK